MFCNMSALRSSTQCLNCASSATERLLQLWSHFGATTLQSDGLLCVSQRPCVSYPGIITYYRRLIVSSLVVPIRLRDHFFNKSCFLLTELSGFNYLNSYWGYRLVFPDCSGMAFVKPNHVFYIPIYRRLLINVNEDLPCRCI